MFLTRLAEVGDEVSRGAGILQEPTNPERQAQIPLDWQMELGGH